MKRLLIGSGLALCLLSSCGGDNGAPDTAGQSSTGGVDTANVQNGGNTGTNMNNDHSNNNQTVNTADSNMRKDSRNK